MGRHVEEWAEAGPVDQHLRLLAAGELLLRCPTAPGIGGLALSYSREECAMALLERAAARAEALQDDIVQACALLASARCRAKEPQKELASAAEEAGKAVALLEGR